LPTRGNNRLFLLLVFSVRTLQFITFKNSWLTYALLSPEKLWNGLESFVFDWLINADRWELTAFLNVVCCIVMTQHTRLCNLATMWNWVPPYLIFLFQGCQPSRLSFAGWFARSPLRSCCSAVRSFITYQVCFLIYPTFMDHWVAFATLEALQKLFHILWSLCLSYWRLMTCAGLVLWLRGFLWSLIIAELILLLLEVRRSTLLMGCATSNWGFGSTMTTSLIFVPIHKYSKCMRLPIWFVLAWPIEALFYRIFICWQKM
jgi:hypothetical protein